MSSQSGACNAAEKNVQRGHPSLARATNLGRVDELVGEALGNALDVLERRLARAGGQEPDGLGGANRDREERMACQPLLYKRKRRTATLGRRGPRRGLSTQTRRAHLVDAAERGHVASLSADGTGAANAARVLAGARVDDGGHQDLERVLSGETHGGGGHGMRAAHKGSGPGPTRACWHTAPGARRRPASPRQW